MTGLAYSFPRYLAAKKSVDDRALNREVWGALQASLPPASREQPLQVLEIGAGIGTMLERMLERRLLSHARYTGIDAQMENIQHAGQRLPAWAAGAGFQVESAGPARLHLARPGQEVEAELEAIDLFDFIQREAGQRQWDLLVAHAFLDLMDIPTTLPQVFRLLRPGGLFYFTINFDGVTLFEPELDRALDEQIQSLYHRSMDERMTNGKPSGDSQAGRHLFASLKAAGAQALAAGASDWVVFPGPQGYPQDEAYFLHFILHFVEQSLAGRPEMEPGCMQRWLEQRHAQVESGELVYIAHQLDFAGRVGA